MGIREVKLDEIESARYGYARRTIKDFLDSGFDAALVDIPEGKTMLQTYNSLVCHIRYGKLGNAVCVTRRKDKIYLIRK